MRANHLGADWGGELPSHSGSQIQIEESILLTNSRLATSRQGPIY